MSPATDFPDAREALRLPAERLAAFRDRIVLRDPRARSLRPGLAQRGREGLQVQGPFQVRRHVVPTKERGVAFVESTLDPNPIHSEGEVVPGAFLAAQFVSAAELLFPALRLERMRVSFTGVCWYGRSIRLSLNMSPSLEPGLEGRPERVRLTCEGVAYQDEREVSRARLEGFLVPDLPPLELELEQVDATWLNRVVRFYEALGIDASAHFHKESGPDLSYPAAFLASLPSGSMVRRFKGSGGILNRLRFDFEQPKLPLAGPPEVDLEPPRRQRSSFNKILTWVKEGVQTAFRGTCLVLPRPVDELLNPQALG